IEGGGGVAAGTVNVRSEAQRGPIAAARRQIVEARLADPGPAVVPGVGPGAVALIAAAHRQAGEPDGVARGVDEAGRLCGADAQRAARGRGADAFLDQRLCRYAAAGQAEQNDATPAQESHGSLRRNAYQAASAPPSIQRATPRSTFRWMAAQRRTRRISRGSGDMDK